MPKIYRTAFVPYSAGQMFELVNNIEDYPHFLPWCKSSKILSKSDEAIQASLLLSKGGLEKSFTTCNRLHQDKSIKIQLLDGPFRHLEGIWQFNTVENGCQISLNLEFEFAGKLLSMAFGPFFNQAANSLVDAFTQRAVAIYGR